MAGNAIPALRLGGFGEIEDFIGEEALLALVYTGFNEGMFERAVYANPAFGQSRRHTARQNGFP